MFERQFFAFTETVIFTEDLLDLTDDETLFAIQNALLANPLLGDLIKGTSGARKGRIGNPRSGQGKRGGFRFIYLYLPRNERFYLLTIYSKREMTDLSAEQARLLGEVIKDIKKLYGEE